MKRRRGRGLRGVTGDRLVSAEFLIGREIGYPPDTRFGSTRGKFCRTGIDIADKLRGTRIPYNAARDSFIKARGAQTRDGQEGSATKRKKLNVSATLIPTDGVWNYDREPSFIGKIVWTPDQEYTPRVFLNNMVRLCEDLACRLSQKQVIALLQRPGRPPLALRCSPSGAVRPR
jgi:hypothetical protein